MRRKRVRISNNSGLYLGLEEYNQQLVQEGKWIQVRSKSTFLAQLHAEIKTLTQQVETIMVTMLSS
jgi:hypothetical protein